MRNNYGNFIEVYHGREDIPDEHRIFAYPKLNIREQMAAYQGIIDKSALDTEKHRSVRGARSVSTSRHFVPRLGGGIAG